jgi:dephospho-CoA kinase
MLRIGITGGLGSGKSTVAHIFEVIGIPVYYADTASKRLMNDDDEVKSSIQNVFGQAAYTKGKLNTKYVSNIVFKGNLLF